MTRGALRLTRLALRRERTSLAAWALGLALLTASVPLSFAGLYPTADQRQAIAATMSSPAAVALIGLNPSPDDYHFGAMTSHQMLFFSAVLVAVMSVLVVVRHTRLEEATGRAELVRSAGVGRHANIVAALLTALVMNLTVGAALTVALAATGVAGIDWPGAMVYGAAHVAVGATFAALTALVSQLFESPRSAAGMSLAAVGAAYSVRAVGDVTGGALSWLSPLGWAQATRPFVSDDWTPLAPAMLAVAVMVGVALFLNGRRDLGSGARAPRPGPATASPGLATPIGLAWRQQRGLVAAWSAANFGMGLMYGAFLDQVEPLLGGTEVLGQMFGPLGDDMAVGFASVIAGVMAAIAAAFPVMAIGRPRAEEAGGRAEPVLTTPVSRTSWLSGHASVAAAGSVLVLLGGGLGLGLAAAWSVGDATLGARLLAALLAYSPAHWVVIGFAVLLYGLAPRLQPGAWGLVGFSFFVLYLGGLLDLPSWLRGISPFDAVPGLPSEDLVIAPLLLLTLVALLLTGIGLTAFVRRDVPA